MWYVFAIECEIYITTWMLNSLLIGPLLVTPNFVYCFVLFCSFFLLFFLWISYTINIQRINIHLKKKNQWTGILIHVKLMNTLKNVYLYISTTTRPTACSISHSTFKGMSQVIFAFGCHSTSARIVSTLFYSNSFLEYHNLNFLNLIKISNDQTQIEPIIGSF